jgi:DNA-directed RNA polymerase subunit RPC12/RpoP
MAVGDFDIQIRLFRCESCGAPLAVPLEGGDVACDFCGARHVVHRRQEARAPEEPRDPLPAPLVEAFTEQSKFRKTLNACEAWWREELARHVPGDRESEGKLYLIAEWLWAWYVHQGDRRRVRALLESLLDRFRGPEIRTLVCLATAREAARCGEVDNAEAWLARCDAASLSVLDGDRRVTQAVIAQAKGRWDEMLRVLGERVGQVAFPLRSARLAAVLRAHALEQLGREKDALRQGLAAVSADAETLRVFAFQAVHHGVAPRTFARVRKRVVWRGIALLLLVLAALAALVGLVYWRLRPDSR